MNKELRGRLINSYSIEYVTDLKWFIESYNTLSDEQRLCLYNEYKCNIIDNRDIEHIIQVIRKSILEMYNNDITDAVLFLYCFIDWYKKSLRSIEKIGELKEYRKLLDFKSVLDSHVICNLGSLLSQNYDKLNINIYR